MEVVFSTNVKAGHEGAPLVVGNTTFLVGPFSPARNPFERSIR